MRILHTNDFHGKLDDEKQEKLAVLRSEADFYFDCGDCIKAGNLAIPLGKDDVWERLDQLDCTASVLGNRETHVLQAAFKKKLEGATHPIVCANVRLKNGERAFLRSLLLEVSGIRIGIFGVMVPMVTERMSTQAASAYLWDPPLPTAKSIADELRPQVDVVIALTHIGLRHDRELAKLCPEIDLILGGHSHDCLYVPEIVGQTAICQTGSHGRYAGVYTIQPGRVATGELISLQ